MPALPTTWQPPVGAQSKATLATSLQSGRSDTMPKPEATPINTAVEDPSYSSAMRVFGGVAWGTLLSLLVGLIMILLPQVPRSWLWAILPLWLGLSSIGVILQWSVARGACPKCGYQMTTSPLGKRCPQCRSYLKAVNRQIIKT